ncbi:MAG: tetratricopeptide repeat protein [Bacteroidota bacterium]
MSKSYNEIALVYESVKLFQTALRYHNKSLHYSERISYLPGQATSYQNIGNIYSSLGGLDTALAFYQKSLDIKTSLSNREDHEDLIHNIGILHLRNGDYQNARNNLNQSLEFRIEIENPIKLADSYYQLGLVHYDEENYQEALLNFIEAIRINPKRTNLTLRALVLEKIANSYILLGDSIKAVRYFLQYENLTDSLSENELMAIEFDSQLQASQHNLVLSKKELDLQVSKSENKTLYIFLLLGGAFLLFLFMLNARNNQRAVIAEKDIEIKDKEIDDLLRDQELSLITAVLNGQDEERQKIATDLHDRLGGILSVVKLHFKTLEKSISKLEERSLEQYEIANKLLNDATTTVREISHDIGDSLLLNLGLIPAVEDLAYSIKSSKQVSVNVLNHGIEARLPIKMEINIYKVIQEAFSNILKHAEAENITLNFIKSEDTISITIEDDGAGFNLDSGASREGLGMLSMRSRVE